MPHRLRWWIALVAVAFALTLALGFQRPSAPPPMARPSEALEEIDWGEPHAQPPPAAEPLLQVEAYITNISDIDLREDQFSIELLLWNRRVIVLTNPVVTDALAGVESLHWIVPWFELLNGDIQTGEQLCAEPQLKALCL